MRDDHEQTIRVRFLAAVVLPVALAAAVPAAAGAKNKPPAPAAVACGHPIW